jgi:hypothetical protein
LCVLHHIGAIDIWITVTMTLLMSLMPFTTMVPI